MKIAKIVAVTTGTNAASISAILGWDYDTTTSGMYIPPTLSTTTELTSTIGTLCDCCDEETTESTTTEELTTTLEPASTFSTTTDKEYTPPEITTTTMPSTTEQKTFALRDIPEEIIP